MENLKENLSMELDFNAMSQISGACSWANCIGGMINSDPWLQISPAAMFGIYGSCMAY